MRVWIDNDGCPRVVRELVLKACQRRTVAVVIVGNSFYPGPQSQLVQAVVVSGGFDAADNHIAENVGEGELVVTSDIPLAARVVSKKAIGLSSRGEVFDQKNIGERLATRNLLQDLRGGGVDAPTGGPPSFSEGDKKRFADAFDRLLTAMLSGKL